MNRSKVQLSRVDEARRKLRWHWVMVGLAAVGFWPLLLAAATLGTAGLIAYGTLVFLGILAWVVTGRSVSIKHARSLVKADDQRQLLHEIEAASAPEALHEPRLEADHPLIAVVSALQSHAAGDAKLEPVVTGLVDQLLLLDADIVALRQAVDVLSGRSTAPNDTRHDRMLEVLAQTESAHGQVCDALRDLHVELTVLSGETRGAVLARATDVWMMLSAQAEVSSAGNRARAGDGSVRQTAVSRPSAPTRSE